MSLLRQQLSKLKSNLKRNLRSFMTYCEKSNRLCINGKTPIVFGNITISESIPKTVDCIALETSEQ